MPHISPKGRKPKAFASLIPMAATLVVVSLGLAACGGSSRTSTTQTTANAAATGTTTTGAAPSGTSSTGTTPPGTSSNGSGSGTGTGTTPTPAGRRNPARFAALHACLARKGIAFPQRTPGSLYGGGAQLPKGMSRAQFAEALRSCGAGFSGHRLLKGSKGYHNPFNNPRFHATLARFAACLRQNGIDVGEPNTSGKGPVFDTKGINTGSPQFKAATAKCRSTLLGALKSPKASPGSAS
jgi:hypothetical protein